jgi:hypothetical protein
MSPVGPSFKKELANYWSAICVKMLQFSIPPGYRRREWPASNKLGPYMTWIDAILEGDRSVHKKQRTAHRILERLLDVRTAEVRITAFRGGKTTAFRPGVG